jgi:hypothetical protein
MTGHDHAHDHGAAALRAGARHVGPLRVSFVLIVAFLVVQVDHGRRHRVARLAVRRRPHGY